MGVKLITHLHLVLRSKNEWSGVDLDGEEEGSGKNFLISCLLL
jgi:hypothetical protein